MTKLAQIFGELLTLLEDSKRDESEAIELTYPDQNGERRVYIPENLHVIGTMNIADRSLALVDLALRRRFAFADLQPELGRAWKEWVQKDGLPEDIVDEIARRMSEQTDIVLDHRPSAQRLVIDTKFNHIFTTGQYGNTSLRSGYVYQMYGYLMSQVGRGKPRWDNANGLLLHPAIGAMVDEWVTIQNHTIRFATVDLTASAQAIREQLLRVIEPT